MSKSANLLVNVGAALYGPRWQSEMARALGCNLRNVQRWASGAFDPPDGLWSDLLALALTRHAEISSIAGLLGRKVSSKSPEGTTNG